MPPDSHDPARTPPGGNGHARAWTVDWACTELAEQYGVNIEPRYLRYILRGLPGLHPVAELPPGPLGGRGAKLYPIADIQALADFLIRRGWLQSPPLTPEQQRDRARGIGKQAERARRRLPARHTRHQGSCRL